jgi:hypothetical protein
LPGIESPKAKEPENTGSPAECFMKIVCLPPASFRLLFHPAGNQANMLLGKLVQLKMPALAMVLSQNF